ncbi:WD40/YVTN/BNR-like repeat-containing protein [Falsibacillus pallidus]|uniref:WD40/YVTN/BNR-like repeat-containing protein n=1 Tax=Falsibacillus pallidus TaxID=493781 RepID=UPI003D9787F4
MKRIIKWSILMAAAVLMATVITGCSFWPGEEASSSDNGKVQENHEKNHDEDKQSTSDNTSGQVDSPSQQGDNNTNGGSDSKSGSDTNTDSGTLHPPAATQSHNDNVQMEEITAVRMIDASSGWIGGKGIIARSDDNGVNWKIQYQGEQTAEQIFALNGKQVWAVLASDGDTPDRKRLLTSNDGGKHWKAVGRMPSDGFLHFTSVNNAFVSNFRTTDGGKTWSKLNTPKNAVGEPYFHDEKNGWAVVQEGKKILIKKTADGGTTWKETYSGPYEGELQGSIIRSMGENDAWVELIGGTGMTQTSYSFLHTSDSGKSWRKVLANSTAGGGPAPGVEEPHKDIPKNTGSKPGPLYVVNKDIAFLGGNCPACDVQNTLGWTKDGGKIWINGKAQVPGYGESLLAMADGDHGWWITNDNENGPVLYSTANGGMKWNKMKVFSK